MQNTNSTNKEEEISIKELIINFKKIINHLKTKIKLIILAGFFGVIIGFLFSFLQKPMYKSKLTFAMEEDKGSSGGGLSSALGIASSLGIDLGGGGAFASNNLTELMKSRLIVEKVLLSPILINNQYTTLAEFYLNFNKDIKLKGVHFLPNSDRKKLSLQQDSILNEMYKKLIDKKFFSISNQDQKSTITTIEFSNNNEIFSKLFCESITNETSKFYIETKSKKAKNNVDVLQNQVDSLRRSLNSAIYNVASEIDNVYNLNPAYNVKGSQSKKKQVDVQANTAILTNLVVQLELAKITLRKETPLIQMIDKPVLPLEKTNIGVIKSVIIGFFISIFSISIILIISKMYNDLFPNQH